MKSNKKIIILAILFVLCLSGCNLTNQKESEEERLAMYNRTLDLVDDINQNSDFAGLRLLEASELTVEEAKRYGPDHPEMELVIETSKVYGYYFPYPNDSEKRYLSQIIIEAKPYHVYGITVEQSLEEARTILINKGFDEVVRESSYGNNDSIGFRQNDVNVIVAVNRDNDIITTITTAVAYDSTGSGVSDDDEWIY
jgi:hypothetical protein